MERAGLWGVAGALALGLVACQASSPSRGVEVQSDALKGAEGAKGCPDAFDVGVVFWHRFEEGGDEGVERLLIHEAIVDDERDDFFSREQRDSGETLHKVITAEQAVAHGASASDEPIWIFGEDGGRCKATPGDFMAFRTGDGYIYTEIARVLTVDCAQKVPYAAPALRLPADPVGCEWVGEAQKRSEPGAMRALNFPEPFGGALDPERCQAPGCDLLAELISTGEASRFQVHELTVTHLYPVAGEHECSWRAENQYGVLVGVAERQPVLWQGVGGFQGFFQDARGPRLLLAREDGVLYTAGLTEQGVAGATTEVQWRIPHEEDGAFHSLAPYCGP